ncbi:MAG: hypothetical protein LBB28_00660, partial [Synergistaceae bacterium]|nr:hypothetical protein [Synergistaceae bacterium]
MLKILAKLFFKILYRLEIKLETLARILETGERTALVPHHASYIDPLLFALFSPREPVAVISPSMTRQKWFKFIKGAFNYVVVDQNDPFAAKHIDDLLKKHNFIVVCPEPEPTTNGILTKLSEPVLSAIETSGAWVIPARACNTQFTPFSRMKGRLVQVTAPKVTLISGEAERLREPGKGGATRGSLRHKMERMLNDVMMLGLWDKKPLFDTLLEQRKLWGGNHIVTIEPDGTRTDWNRFITMVFVMRRIIERLTKKDERVGIMLPNSTAAITAIIGTQHADKEPAMMNYSM